jgi:hypothetical protein
MKVHGAEAAHAASVTFTGIGSIALLGSGFISVLILWRQRWR